MWVSTEEPAHWKGTPEGSPCSPNYTREEVLIYGTTHPASQGTQFFFHASWMQRKRLPAGAPQWLLPKGVAASLKGEGDGECFLWDEGPSTPPPLINPMLLVGIWGSTMEEEGICEATSALHLRKSCQQPEREEDEMDKANCIFLEVWGVQTMSTHIHHLLFKISP